MSNAVFKVKWRSPANIALIKYWGKYDHQIPANPSISFTLEHAYTETSIAAFDKKNDAIPEIHFLFEGKEQPVFEKKIINFLKNNATFFPFLSKYRLEIHSSNSFPHSAGIASSASSMSALVLCLQELALLDSGQPVNFDDTFLKQSSEISRLASGSACRSLYGGLVTWGAIDGIEHSSNHFATPLQGNIPAEFLTYQDAVLVVSSKEKATSSRAGHALMNEHPYHKARYKNAQENLLLLIEAIRNKDWNAFIDIVEFEALNLHALMMTSHPSVVLLLPESVQLIHQIRAFRKQTGIPICFTIDAGPNIHLLYPNSNKKEVNLFIENQLSHYCASKYWIADNVGKGPLKLA